MKTDSHLSATDRSRLDALYGKLEDGRQRFMGYPCNQSFDYSELNRFLEFVINNVGDPFGTSGYLRMHTHEFEREVIAQFAKWTHAPDDDHWGYVTNGGTEGNMYGIYLARELYPNGLVYFSEDTHYSVTKIMRLVRARNIMIKSQSSGEIDYDDLRESIRLHRDVPPIIFANIGTTMKGAVDNLGRIHEIMEELVIREFYIHCDAALSGMILPFIEQAQPFDFAAGAHSISISGHKFIGSPLPCGVVLARRHNVDRIARSVEYVGALDTTLSGSRNAFTPLLLWYAIKRWGEAGFRDLVGQCLTRADYAIARFAEADIRAWRNENSITVVFPRPSDELLKRWQVAPFQKIGHLIPLPHVTEELVNEFVDEVAKDLLSQNQKSPVNQP